MQEYHSLESQLPLHFHSSIFVRIDENRPYLLRVLITAPTKTPYDSGCFIFDIYCPLSYPSDPPKVNLMTTGGGSVRFNPNLYEDGYVCLSLLGTWDGTGSERWGPESTIFQVLLSIQSAILGSEFPYFNEPGVEEEWGTSDGLENARTSENGGYEYLRKESIRLAIIGQLKNPMEEFKEVIDLHFYLKIKHILTVTKQWTQEASTSDTEDYYYEILTRRKKLILELIKLASNESVCSKIENYFTVYNHAVLELLESNKISIEEELSFVKSNSPEYFLPQEEVTNQNTNPFDCTQPNDNKQINLTELIEGNQNNLTQPIEGNQNNLTEPIEGQQNDY